MYTDVVIKKNDERKLLKGVLTTHHDVLNEGNE